MFVLEGIFLGVLNFLLFFIRMKFFLFEFLIGLLREDLLFFVVLMSVFFIKEDDLSCVEIVILFVLVKRFVEFDVDDFNFVV